MRAQPARPAGLRRRLGDRAGECEPGDHGRARSVNPVVVAEFPPEGSRLRTLARCPADPQWSKNVLVLVPLLLGHKLHDPTAILHCVLGMLLLSLAASGTYLLNDLADLNSDRQHRKKRHRPSPPAASGRCMRWPWRSG
jgi:hypothetical protein